MKNGGQRIIVTEAQMRKWESVMRKLNNQLEKERLENNKKKKSKKSGIAEGVEP